MRLAMFMHGGQPGIAASDGGGPCHGILASQPDYPGDLDDLVAGESDLVAVGKHLLAAPVVELGGALLPPLRKSGKIICVGLNYADHASETGHARPSYPTIFSRFTSSLVGHGAPIIRPLVSAELDYEGEFVAVIGHGGRSIAKADALKHVVAYTLFNDGSVRDYQMRTPQWTVGKNFDGTGAFGPWLVTADELPPGCAGLRLQTRLNGQTVQDASTNDLLFDVASLVSLLSEAFTLSPGDVIVTGTPAGVGGMRKPQLFMKAGDVCEIEMEGLGVLSNPIADQVA